MTWFGGKSRVASTVWEALGDVQNYVEPFFGSGAVLLGRPHEPKTETVNDKDGFVCNFWRALQSEPDAVAYYADRPVNECDLHARHTWLVRQSDLLVARLEGDPDYYDPIIAGYWVWGICTWIGSGFCRGKGPWHVVDGKLVKLGNAGKGVNRQLVHLADAGLGVHRKLAYLADGGIGVHRPGVNRKLPLLAHGGAGVHSQAAPMRRHREGLLVWMQDLAARLRFVRVACGDWSRVMGPAVTEKNRVNGIFLDPPYAQRERSKVLYREEMEVADEVRQWAIDHGDNPKLRIVLCGYEGEHDMPDTWRVVAWKSNNGYANRSKTQSRGKKNTKRERLWLSPHCLEVG